MEKVRIKDKMRSAYTPKQWLGIQIEKIREHQFEESFEINNWEIRHAIHHNPENYEWLDKEWLPYTLGNEWGGENYTAFFRSTLTIPKEFDGKYTVLRLKPGGEGLLRKDGIPFAGLDTKHTTVFLSEKAEAGKTYKLQIEQTVNEMEVPLILHRFQLAQLAVLNREIEDAYFDFKCLFDVVSTPQTGSEVAQFILHEMKNAMALVDLDTDEQALKKSLKIARVYLKEHIYNSGKYKHEGRLNMVGHSHLDLVYQWDYNEFLRKIGRTHSTTLNVMREFPEYLFCQSQLKLYEDLKRLYPEIYKGIQQRVKDNRWEVIGGMYVEPDCNLISGESFVRQLLVGNKVALEEFGTTSSVCWLPDVFGITWFIPQILERAGYKYLITNKPVIWNDTNEMPYNTFRWEGPDGSGVMVHLPSTHFGAKIDADVMQTNWNEYKEKIECSEAIYNYGYADGRGGPNRDDILTGRRYKQTPGVPESEFTHGMEAFERMEKTVDTLPILKNELYLETHRGTYTTQARLKKNNRKSEILYRNLEMMASLASLAGADYPKNEINEGWKLILKNQFHDILPGSHVNSAYYDAQDDYKEIFKIGADILNASLKNLLGGLHTTNQAADSFVVFNMQAWKRSETVEVEIKTTNSNHFVIKDSEGQQVNYQIMKRENEKLKLLVETKDIPPVGYKVYNVIEREAELAEKFEAKGNCIETGFYSIAFDDAGNISELYDKKNKRFVIESGNEGNKFQLFKDVPGKYAAWDIVPMYKEMEFEMPAVQRTEIVENGPLRVVIKQERKFYKSEIKQDIILYRNSPRIDFVTEIDWQERDRLLKVAFPVEVNAMNASYDISYGYIERPTHKNTSWDAAKFEVCGHMWADLSEGDYGVSLLNDCKYGHDIQENVMRLTLLKGPQYPDPKADLGKHSFTYSLLPHAGGWREANIARKAWELNDALTVTQVDNASTLPATDSFLEIDRDHVMLSAFKVAEDGDGVIIRVYEDQNRRGEVTVSFKNKLKNAIEVDPFENEIDEAKMVNGALQFFIKPFEIRTFKVFF